MRCTKKKSRPANRTAPTTDPMADPMAIPSCLPPLLLLDPEEWDGVGEVAVGVVDVVEVLPGMLLFVVIGPVVVAPGFVAKGTLEHVIAGVLHSIADRHD
jgi:hypothetical protein